MIDCVKLCLLFVHRGNCSQFRTVGFSHRVVSTITCFYSCRGFPGFSVTKYISDSTLVYVVLYTFPASFCLKFLQRSRRETN